ncbi:hypothetical protein QOZ80_7BG0593910 [Eleusine coracana subsp. coracana]|nr:hypothetical protein QOZ80_7BG0593910 [Eleusine coracana subsp. coracana]
MADDEGQPDWSQLQADLLEHIAEKTRDPVTGVTLFRSICRSWRAAVADAPRLLLPLPFDSAAPRAGSPYALVFPLARGWSIIVDVRDTSCHLSHLATGATAPLPSLNAVRATAGSHVVRRGYKHFKEEDPDDAPAAAAAAADPRARARPDQRRFLVKHKFRLAAATPVGNGNRGKKVRRRWKVRMNPLWKKSLLPEEKEPTPCSKYKIQIKILYFYMLLETDLAFSNMIRFAAHVPASAPAGCTDGMLIMTYHPVQGHTGLSFCRPGDAAWTMVPNPVTHNDEEYGGRWGGGRRCRWTRPKQPAAHLSPPTFFLTDVDHLHLVALPSKLILVRARVVASVPDSFDIFELNIDSDGDDRMSWCKMIDGIGGDLFLDDHHATFFSTGCGTGPRETGFTTRETVTAELVASRRTATTCRMASWTACTGHRRRVITRS